MKIHLIFSILFFTCNKFIAQDIHWSQFNENPLYLSPSNSGDFKGNSRFIANYRDQWRTVTKPFQTFSFSYDTRIESNQKIGLGFLLLNDVEGDGKFKTFELQILPSYRFLLKKDSSHQLLAGVQLAFNHRQFTFPNFYFDEQYNGINYDPNSPITEDLITSKKNNLTIGSGITYKLKRNTKENYQIGLSAFNLNQPNQGFYGTKIKRDIRMCFYIKATLKVKDRIDLIPSLLFQSQGTYREFIFGSQLKYLMKNETKNYKALYVGLFFRKKDAFYLNAGIDYNKWYLGLSYDINVSTLKPASSSRGGLEISMRYILSRFKPKQIQHRICPEFI